ncbi:sigma-70 family RNA polymerase sigma factor [Sporosarcina sp. NPDC096371]|uniref:sigma-70 family RNA polymerase sigma factor n=1 Tax=Sporosarcina sp. NPDC096371 TaxID=3364530 RepID=UPI003812D7CD
MKSNEGNFVKRLQRQKEDALDFVVDTYLPIIKGITYKVLIPLKDQGVIDECLNDIFLSIWNNSNKFKGDSTDFRKWICTIAKFKAIDYYRKASKEVAFSSDYMDVNADLSAEDELILLEDRTELIRLINQLEPVEREIFIMKFFLGYKTEEIGKKLGLTNTSVDNRVYRGKKKLYQKAITLELGESRV